MSTNILLLPFKSTRSIPTLSESIVEHILGNIPNVHRDEIESDANGLARQRECILVEQSTRVDQVALQELTDYFMQLSFILTKFPDDIACSFPWYQLFTTPPSSTLSLSPLSLIGSFAVVPIPIEASSLQFERLSVLFNIGVMLARLAAECGRKEVEGLKAGLNHYQNAAGVFSHLLTLLPLLPTLTAPLSAAPSGSIPVSPDLTINAISSLRDICLAQAQEGVWLKGVMDRLREGTIAKLSLAVSEYYSSAATFAVNAKGGGVDAPWPGFSFPSEMVNHLKIKSMHFEAAAMFRKSSEDLGANRYGDELSRLTQAAAILKKASEISSRGIASSVLDDMKGLRAKVSDNLARAIKDNTLIYLAAPTPLSSLPRIIPAVMAISTVPQSIASPLSLRTRTKRLWFSHLINWEVQLAMKIYDDRKDGWLNEAVIGMRENGDRIAANTLQALNLPGSIQALSLPIGLPPSLITKAADVRVSGGAAQVKGLMKDVGRVSRSCRRILDEALEALSAEDQSDTHHRLEYGLSRWTRPPSTVANSPLRTRAGDYARMLEEARKSDAIVKSKWHEWEKLIGILGSDESTLEGFVPSLAVSPASFSLASSTTPEDVAASLPLRTLRRLLDELDDLHAIRSTIVDQSRRAVASDNIRDIILTEATRLETTLASRNDSDNDGRRIEVAMFEPVLEREMKKFERFQTTMEDNCRRQSQLLEAITSANSNFLSSRRSNPTLLAREKALQDLDTAYHKYQELVNNLQEGLKFYAAFSKLLAEFRTGWCKTWINSREMEARNLLNQIQNPTPSLTSDRPDVASDALSTAYDPSKPIVFG